VGLGEQIMSNVDKDVLSHSNPVYAV